MALEIDQIGLLGLRVHLTHLQVLTLIKVDLVVFEVRIDVYDLLATFRSFLVLFVQVISFSHVLIGLQNGLLTRLGAYILIIDLNGLFVLLILHQLVRLLYHNNKV